MAHKRAVLCVLCVLCGDKELRRPTGIVQLSVGARLGGGT
jgi:hypothetical protein